MTFDSVVEDRLLTVSYIYAAPRNLVWDAWTIPEQMEQWYGPEGFSARVEQNDVVTGGKWRNVLIGPDGTEYPSEGMFFEVIPGEKLVSTDDFGEEFKAVSDLDLPEGMVSTIMFQDVAGGTKVTVQIQHPSVAERIKHEEMGVVPGWQSMLICLERFLAL